MATKITVRPNQTMSDVILQATGSMEAGMQFCYDNEVAISEVPAVGTVYVVSDAALALGDAGVRKYVERNGVQFGNLAPDVPLKLLADEEGEVVFEDEEGGVVFEDE